MPMLSEGALAALAIAISGAVACVGYAVTLHQYHDVMTAAWDTSCKLQTGYQSAQRWQCDKLEVRTAG